MTSAIAVEQATLSIGGQVVLAGASLVVARGEVVALVGPSGSGKTSLLRLVLGFVAPGTGAVRLDGREASRDSKVLVAPEHRGLAVVFQDLALWPHLTVAGNLEFGLAAQRVPREERALRVATLLRRVGLEGRASRYPGELSGGERQRVAIARALVLEPRAVLLDEPLSNVDVDLRRDLIGLFRELFTERGTTALYVTHDLREAAAIANRVAVLEGGRIVQDGSCDELQRAPATPFVRALVDDLAGGGNLTQGSGKRQ
jgi:ABC-type Fe3+/spermidine/putrescine transport system ATPase subunit